ncbi:hypothetical protein [Thiohalophilus sp.]|uniref:hypothetical protein n=1 Tax=Thiohalophilus sp. TaxID=3028392 RepID=UPI002ACE6BD3|nr:hypothetical protein [Thiohalophilus sp.]MDZ7662593.1 hypothetical protein [Thiohalophilus sp.]
MRYDMLVAAYHEAGHAVMALECNFSIAQIAVITPSTGYVTMRQSHVPYLHCQTGSQAVVSPVERLHCILKRIYVLLAGPAAEYEVRKLPHYGPGTAYFVDHDMINEILAQAHVRELFDKHVPQGLLGLQGEVETWVMDSRVWERIEVLADALLQEHRLDWDAIEAWLVIAGQRQQMSLF